MTEHGLSLAMEKAKVVVLVKGEICTVLFIQVGVITIEFKPGMKYLGMILDSDRSVFNHVRILLHYTLY